MWARPRGIRSRFLILATSVLTVGTLVVAAPAQAAPRRPAPPPVPALVPVHPVKAHPAPRKTMPSWHATAVTWPHGAADVTLASTAAAPVRAGTLPVWLARPAATHPAGARATAAASQPVRMRVEVATREAANAAGVNGALLTLSGSGAVAPAGRLRLTLDYRSMRAAFGGDWASRLRLVALPSCAVRTPQAAGCRRPAPVASTNDATRGQLSGDVVMPSRGPLVVAATSGVSGGGGDFSATSLRPEASWQAGGSNGSFDWSYPIDTPAVPGGLEPDIELGYSSQSVDGLISSTNNQASWIGDGWDYHPGYIERSYQSCSQNPAGATKTGDNCWSDNDPVTLSLNGQSTTLIRDDATGGWHPRDDNGERVQLCSSAQDAPCAGAANGAYNGEYWVITDAHGVRYYFGLNHLPGYAPGDAETHSAWTEPVFATKSGQPCYNATFANSYCANVAYRWNLDYVVDPHADTVSYFYKSLTGYYARDNGTTANAAYVRGGFLTKAEYGQRDGQVYTTQPAAQVLFTATGRCNQSACDVSTLSSSAAAAWPDVPYDLNCASGATCGQTSPSFWSEYRLKSIQTQVLVGANEQNVDSWSLSASFPATGDTTTPALWLDSITHTGQAGAAITLPAVTFTGQSLANRVNTTDGYPPITRYRLQQVITETGEDVSVKYSAPDCASGTPADPSTNTTLCYPAYWTPAGQPSPIKDWFNKFVVSSVTEGDGTGGGLPVVTSYTYASPAWHYDDDPLTPSNSRTWNSWRGYQTVREFTGQAPDPITESQTTYFRGMDGDTLPDSGTRSAKITDSRGDPAVTDADELAGMAYEEIVYDGSGGAVLKDTITDPWSSAVTATHDLKLTGVQNPVAHLVSAGDARVYTPLSNGSTRATEVDNTYDAYGRITKVNDLGDLATSADDKCTTTAYATNTTSWILDAPDEVSTVSVNCAAKPSLPADAVSDVRTFYDNSTTLGAAPTHGDATMVQDASSYTGSTPSFVTETSSTVDEYGRTLTSTDADGRTTTTAYTPTTGAAPTQATVTDPMGYVTTTLFDARRGLPTRVTDPAGYVSASGYDALGRMTAGWRPGQATTALPNVKYSYAESTDAPSTVTTQTLNEDGSTYRTSITLYDSLLRERETQTETVDGRTVSDIVYNTDGWKVRTTDPYQSSGAPSGTLVDADDATVPSSTGYTYDGSGRPTVVSSNKFTTETWRTTYVYGGNFTTEIPPDGGTARTTFVDARDRTSDIYYYHSGVAVDPVNDPAADYDHLRYTYTPNDDVASITDPAGNVWTRTYNLLGQQLTDTDPDTGRTTMSYDDAGQLLSTTDARGKTITTTYDPDGRKKAKYDTTGGAAPGPSNQLASWTYDTLKKGYLTSSTAYLDGNAYTTAILGYDRHGLPIARKVVLPESEGALAPTNGYVVQYTYNTSTGRLATRTDQAAGGLPQETVTYGADNYGRVTSVRGIWDYADNISYTDFDEPQQYTFGPSGAWVQLTLTLDRQTHALDEAEVTDSATAGFVDDTSYTRNHVGDITAITDKQSAAVTDTRCFRYDYLQRLSAAWTATDGCAATPSPGNSPTVGGPLPFWQSWTFDAAGNRFVETDHDTGGNTADDTTTTYHYPASGSGSVRPHALSSTTATGPGASKNTATYGYDPTGNTSSMSGGPAGNQTLTWNDQGQLSTDTTAAGTTHFLYDADGDLLLRKDPGQTTLYLDDEQLVLPTGTGTVTGTRNYQAAGTDVAVRSGSGAVSYLIPDQQGTDELAIDSASEAVTRRQYLPYGQARGTAPISWPDGDKGYVGGTTDPTTSLVNLGAREYDPGTGRFLSSDPILEGEDLTQLGGYAYAADSPVTHSDPSGQMVYDDITHKGFGSGKAVTQYHKKHAKATKRMLAEQRRAYNVYRHSAYYRIQSTKAYQRAYLKHLNAVYKAISETNYPPLRKYAMGPVPSGGNDVLYSATDRISHEPFLNKNVTWLFSAPTNVAYTYYPSISNADQQAVNHEFANQWGWNVSSTVGVKAKLWGLEETSASLTIGFNGSYSWKSGTTKTKTVTVNLSQQVKVKPGQSIGLSPGGFLDTYETTYLHADGRVTTRRWTTANVTSWTPTTYSKPWPEQLDAGMQR